MIEFEAKIKGIAVPGHYEGYDYQTITSPGNVVVAYKYETDNEGGNSQAIVPLPKSEYEIIGLTSEILKSEEMAKKVVDEGHWVDLTTATHLKRDYKQDDIYQMDWTYVKSLQSLLDKYNIVGENLILKRL